MKREANLEIARKLLDLVGGNGDQHAVEALFSPDVGFDIPGDDGALPWIGRKRGRQAAADFLEALPRLTESVEFTIQDILASDARAVILARIVTRVKATGRVTQGEAAIVLEIADGRIDRFLMIEDSFDVSRSARA